MDAIERTITQARRRWWLNRSLWWLAALVLAGLAAAVVMLLCGDLLGLICPWWGYVILLGAVLIASPVAAWLARPSDDDTAAMIDHRLGLKDRLATALHVRRRDPGVPFADQVIADALRAAGQAKVSRAFTVRPTRLWAYVPVAAVVVVLVALLVPGNVDLLGLNQQHRRMQAQAKQAQAARQHLIEASSRIQNLTEHSATPTPGTPKATNPDDLMHQIASLSNRDLRTPQSRQQAAVKISSLSNQLQQVQQQKQQQFQSVANAMTQLDTGEQGPADKLANALRRGDFQNAQQELQHLQNQMDQGALSSQQQKQLQQQLGHMSKQLKQMARQAKKQQAQASKQIQKQLGQAGLSPHQIQQLSKQSYNSQATQKALQQNGQSAQQAKQTSQQVRKQAQQGQSSGQLSHSLDGLSKSFGQMSSAGQSSSSKQGKQGNQSQRQAASGSQEPHGRAGQQGQSQFQQGAWSAGKQMGQIARMRHQIEQMRQAQSQMRQAMRQMAGGAPSPSLAGGNRGAAAGGSKTNKGKTGDGSRRVPSNTTGGIKAGTGSGGNPLGQPYAPLHVPTSAKADIELGKGRVIASWLSHGGDVAGAPKVSFDTTLRKAKEAADQAVAEDRVPHQYDAAIHDYFNQLPQKPSN